MSSGRKYAATKIPLPHDSQTMIVIQAVVICFTTSYMECNRNSDELGILQVN